MGLFDIFKKKKENEKVEFEYLGNYLDDRLKDLKIQEKEFLKCLEDSRSFLVSGLNKLLEQFKNLSVEDKKIDPRAMIIIKENYHNYISYLEKFINNLEEIKSSNPLDMLEELNNTIFGFEKRSDLSFNKATIIIGDIGKVKDLIDDFFGRVKRLVKEHNSYIELRSRIISIKDRISLLDSISVQKNELVNSREMLSLRIFDLSSRITVLERESEDTRSSQEYRKESEEIQTYERLKTYHKESIISLKQKIDFKLLSSYYHLDRQKLQTVNRFRENFSEEYLAGNFSELLDLIKSMGSDLSTINESLEKIETFSSDIRTPPDESHHKKLLGLSGEIERIQIELVHIKDDQLRIVKKIDKLMSDFKVVKEELIPDLEKIKIELVD